MKFDEDDKIRAMLNAIPDKDFYQINNITVKIKKETFPFLIETNRRDLESKPTFKKYVEEKVGHKHTLCTITAPPKNDIETELMYKFKGQKDTDTTYRKKLVREYLFKLFFGETYCEYEIWRKNLDDAIKITIESEMKKGKRRLFNLAVEELKEKHPKLYKNPMISYYSEQNNRFIRVGYNLSSKSYEIINAYNMKSDLYPHDIHTVAYEYEKKLSALLREYKDKLESIPHKHIQDGIKVDEILPKNMIKKVKEAAEKMERKKKAAIQEMDRIHKHNEKLVNEYEKKRKKLEEEYNKEHHFSVQTINNIDEKHESKVVLTKKLTVITAILQNTSIGIKKINNIPTIIIRTPAEIKILPNKQSVSTSTLGSNSGKRTLHVCKKTISYNHTKPHSWYHYADLVFFVVWDGNIPGTYSVYAAGAMWKDLSPKDIDDLQQDVLQHLTFLGTLKEEDA